MKRLPRLTPFGVLVVLGTALSALIAFLTNSLVAYFVLVSFVVAWALVALRSTSPMYRQAEFGEDPIAAAEQRGKYD